MNERERAEDVLRECNADVAKLATEHGIIDRRIILALKIAWCDGRLNGLAWGRERMETFS